MRHEDEENLDELMDIYASAEDVHASAREKEESEQLTEDIGVQLKDYPKAQRELDLHGMYSPEAMRALQNFISRAVNQRVLTVRVITGKGLHSKNFKSVLPELTEKKLGEMRRAGQVLAFKRERSGGAFIVYL